MARKITDECQNCGACEEACGFDAISEGDGKHVIDPDLCQDCGACQEACPFDAIVED